MNQDPEDVLKVLRAIVPSRLDLPYDWADLLTLTGVYCVVQVVLSVRSLRAASPANLRIRIELPDRFFHIAALPMLLWSLWANRYLMRLFEVCGSPTPRGYLLLLTSGVLSTTIALCGILALCGLTALVWRSRPVVGLRRDTRHERALFFLAGLPTVANWYFVVVISVVLVATQGLK